MEHFLQFTRGERNACIALLVITLVLFIAPYAYIFFVPVESVSPIIDDKEVSNFIAEYERSTKPEEKDQTAENEYNPYLGIDAERNPIKKDTRVVDYFSFDPNLIGITEWIKLGFSQKQAELIERYKAKGGKFYKPEDLKKIYVVSDKDYERLAPYIIIQKQEYPKSIFKRDSSRYAKVIYIVDINTADSSLFERQRGIGPALARRIINYRNRLGGFVSVEQISEVWGLPDSTYQSLRSKMTVTDAKVNQVNINTSNMETMRLHPYINYSLARIIYNYRLQHGLYSDISDLKKLVPVTDSIYKKLAPYITVQ